MKFFNLFKYLTSLIIFSSLLAVQPQVLAKTDNGEDKQKLEQFFSDLEDFTRVFSDIRQLYVDEVDNKNLFDDAIKGMVSGLDPHSSYLEPKEQEDLMENTSGKFGGLGIVIIKKYDAIKVISPIDDTPAYRAGIQAGDLIVKINDKPVSKMSLEDGVDLMRGEPKTKVKITVVRENQKPFVVEITREIITIISVKGYLLEKNIGYIRIASFQNPTADLLKTTLDKLVSENEGSLDSLILDLRNNPGGVLEGAIDVSNLFIDKKGLVVYTEGRIKSSNIKFKTEPGDIMNDSPIVVLINEGSASASEIVAGALQDHKRAIIMGKTSFGKGSVQTIIKLNEGYGLKITTARYYTPSGRSIQAKGIKPDIELKNISLENEEEEVITRTKEKDLNGHLETEVETTDDETKVETTDDETKLKDPSKISSEEIIESQEKIKADNDKKTIERLKKDYFVHEATNLLKALTILDK